MSKHIICVLGTSTSSDGYHWQHGTYAGYEGRDELGRCVWPICCAKLQLSDGWLFNVVDCFALDIRQSLAVPHEVIGGGAPFQ